jgi:ribosomal protein S18 acetylase RimI-like enzyme
MTDAEIIIRPAERGDLPALGKLGAQLVGEHYAFDARRFMKPEGDLAEGYAHFLGTQRRNRQAIVLVAAHDSDVAGYLYAAIAPVSWESLRDEAGYIHDVIVDPRWRGHGVASRLMEAAIAWFRERGMPRVILQTAHQNDAAQSLFTRLGFRPTMIEMTKEIPPP